MKHEDRELELGLGGAKPTRLNRSRSQRAAWWFARMRQAVDAAFNWQPGQPKLSMKTPHQLLTELADWFDLTIDPADTSLKFERGHPDYGDTLIVTVNYNPDESENWEMRETGSHLPRTAYASSVREAAVWIQNWLPEPKVEFPDSLIPPKPRYH